MKTLLAQTSRAGDSGFVGLSRSSVAPSTHLRNSILWAGFVLLVIFSQSAESQAAQRPRKQRKPQSETGPVATLPIAPSVTGADPNAAAAAVSDPEDEYNRLQDAYLWTRLAFPLSFYSGSFGRRVEQLKTLSQSEGLGFGGELSMLWSLGEESRSALGPQLQFDYASFNGGQTVVGATSELSLGASYMYTFGSRLGEGFFSKTDLSGALEHFHGLSISSMTGLGLRFAETFGWGVPMASSARILLSASASTTVMGTKGTASSVAFGLSGLF